MPEKASECGREGEEGRKERESRKNSCRRRRRRRTRMHAVRPCNYQLDGREGGVDGGGGEIGLGWKKAVADGRRHSTLNVSLHHSLVEEEFGNQFIWVCMFRETSSSGCACSGLPEIMSTRVACLRLVLVTQLWKNTLSPPLSFGP